VDELLLNYGIAGVMLIVLLAFAHQTIERLIRDRDRAIEKCDTLTNDVFTIFAPAIKEATEAIRARELHDDKIYDVLIDVRRLLEN
jgi:hypothetical protein